MAISSGCPTHGIGGIEVKRQYGGTNLGINFWFDDTSSAYFDSVLPLVAATNCHVKIEVHHKVVVADGYNVIPYDDANFTVIKRAITKSQALGITVDMLMIYMEDSVNWAAPINPTGGNVAAFFHHHQLAAQNVAALCNSYNIPILGLVNECSYLTNSDKTPYWAKETAAIRAAYPKLKLIGASTTWNAETKKLLDYKLAGTDNFWNYTDFCGINTYPGLTADVDPDSITDEELLSEWYDPQYPQQSYMNSSLPEHIADIRKAFGKDIMILEIGCVPWERGFYDPLGQKGNTPVNKNVQARYLKSAYEVLGDNDFVAGIYIWDVCDTHTPFYWLDNTELVPCITAYYKSVFSPPTPQPPIDPKELLVNGIFSNGSQGWVVDSGSWDFSTGVAVCKSTDGAWGAGIFQYVNAVANTKYTLTVGTNTGYVLVQAADSSYAVLGGNLLVLNKQTGSFTFTAPANTAHLQIILMNGTYKSNIQFDNLSLKASSPELVVNGDFANGSANWSIIGGSWDFSSGAAVCAKAGGTWDAGLFQYIAATGNTQYTLSAGVNTGVIQIIAARSDWSTITRVVPTFETTTPLIFTTPPETARIQLILSSGNHTSDIRFDGVSIKAV